MKTAHREPPDRRLQPGLAAPHRIRIANGQWGILGDWLEAPVRLVDQGPIDFLVLDYLAEVTMSILQKQKQEDPELGYARDFPPPDRTPRAEAQRTQYQAWSPTPEESIRRLARGPY